MGAVMADMAVKRGEFVVYKGDEPVARTSDAADAQRIRDRIGGWVREPRGGRR